MYTNFCIAADYGKPLEEGRIRQTLGLICDEYPNLRSNVRSSDSEGSNPELYYIEQVDYSSILRIVDDESLSMEEVFREIQDVSFKYGDNKPLWKLILLNKTRLFFYSDHLLSDGMSGSNFHEVFKEKYQTLTSTKHDQVMPAPDDIIGGYDAPLLSKLYILGESLLPDYCKQWLHYLLDPYKDLSYKTMPKAERDSKSDLKILTYGNYKEIIAMCRAHDVKLTSLLAHLGLLAAGDVTRKHDTFTIIPTNARPLMKPTDVDTKFGLFMGHIDFKLPAMDQFDWETTKRIHRTIHEDYQRCCYDLGMMRFVDPKELLFKNNKSVNGPTLEVSNIGKSSLDEMWFDQLTHSTLFVMSAACGAENLHISVRSLQNKLLEPFCEKVQGQLSKLLQDFNKS